MLPHIKEMVDNAGVYVCGFPGMDGVTTIQSDGKGSLLMPNSYRVIDAERLSQQTIIEGPYNVSENPTYIEYNPNAACLHKPSPNSQNVDQALFCSMVYQLDACVKMLTNLLGSTMTCPHVPRELWKEASEVAADARKFIS